MPAARGGRRDGRPRRAAERGFVNAVLRRLAAEPPAPPAGADDRGRRRADRAGRRGRCASSAAARRPTRSRRRGRRSRDRARADASARTRAGRAARELEEALARGGRRPGDAARSTRTCLADRRGRPAALPGFDARAGSRSRTRPRRSSSAALDPQTGRPRPRRVRRPGRQGGCTSPAWSGPTAGGRWPPTRPRASALVARAAERLGRDRVAGRAGRAGARARAGRSTACWSTRRARGSARPGGAPSSCGGARKDELAGLARLQVAIATAAADLLRPGGRLVYSSARSRAPRPTPPATRSCATAPTSSRSRSRAPTAPAERHPSVAPPPRMRRDVRRRLRARVVGPRPLGA